MKNTGRSRRFLCLLALIMCLFVTNGNAFVLPAPLPASSTIPTSSSSTATKTTLCLYNSVEAAIAEAQRICAVNPSSQECKVAWDIVEELEAANSHKDGKHMQLVNDQTNIDAFVGSLDILIQKIDGKMDQLKATTIKMHELGATDPSIENLYAKADEMKQALAQARASLNR